MRMWIAVVVLSITTPVCAQTAGSSSGASVVINDPPSTTTTTRLITAPAVGAPGLAAAGVETCLGSAAGGLSLMGGGFTFGSTRVDEGCTIRLLARQLYAFGFQKAALALMCEDKHVALAMGETGTPCPVPPGEAGTPLAALSDPATTSSIETSEPVHVSALPWKPFSQREEQAWFDRASNMN